MMEKFVVRHYACDERPIIKGNGFDGLEVGEDREEAEEFIEFVNRIIQKCQEAGIEIKRKSIIGS